MAVLSTINGYGTHAARPAAGTAGATYFETDTGLLFRDSGSAWQSINLASLVTTKGDLLAATGAGAVARVGVGSDGLPVVADSSQAGGLNYGGVVGGTAFAPSGLTGSVAASRYVGATASVAPTTGAHLLGDWVTTQDGKVFICTTAGTPGTWTQVGGSSITTASAQLSSDVAMSSINTYYDGPSVSLAVGTWLLLATVTLEDSAIATYTVKLWDGTTTAASAGGSQSVSGGGWVSPTLVGIVSPTGTTTYKISAAFNTVSGAKIRAAAATNAAGNTASTIVAAKLS